MSLPPRVSLRVAIRQRAHLNLHHAAVVDGHRRLGVPWAVSAWIHDLGMGHPAGDAAARCRADTGPGRTSDGHEALLALSAALIGGVDLGTVVEIVGVSLALPGHDLAVPDWVAEQVPVINEVIACRSVPSDESAPSVSRVLKEIDRIRHADAFTGSQFPLEHRFDWPREYLGYLHAGLAANAKSFASFRVPLRIGSRCNFDTFQAWRFRELVQATEGDLDMVEALVRLTDDPALTWANVDEAIRMSRTVGSQRALLLLAAGVRESEAPSCPADDQTLAAMAALRGPVPFPAT